MLPIDAINKLARRAARTNIAIIESAARGARVVLHYGLMKAGCIACTND